MTLTQIRILWSMCLFEAQRFRAYPHEIVASLTARFAEVALYITFWLLVGQFAASGDVDATDIIGYYLIITGLIPFFYSGFGIASQIIEQIKTGQLSQTLIRPINPVLYPWANRTGRNAINILVGAIQVLIGIILMGGIEAKALPFLLPTILNAAAINFAFNLLIGTTAFYVTEGRGIKNSFAHVASFLRGERMPIFLMPMWLQDILMLTPFPASQYHLAITLQGTRMPEWNDVLLGCVWSVVLLAGAIMFWRYGLRKYEAVGL